jgi:hypothetical protein
MTLPRQSLRSLMALSLLCFGTLAAESAAAPPKTGVVAGTGTMLAGAFTAGPHGAEYQLPSQARLRLAPGSIVRLFPVPQNLQLAPGPKTTTHSFALVAGRVDVTVPSRPKSAVLCSVNALSVVVSNGRATIVTRGDTTTVAGNAGDVRTLLADRWQTLTPGTLARFRGEQSTGIEPVVAAPALAPGQRLWFSAGEPIAITGFAFSAAKDAAQYELRLRRPSDGAEQSRLVRGSLSLREPFSPVATGRYELAIRSIDAQGIAGKWSPEEPVRVVGVTLPPGGYALGGDIFLGRGQEARFSHTEGLEMTYEGAGRYVPASGAVSLYRGETTVVSFRVPGSIYPTTARLRPRSLYAQVDIGPSRAAWPRDTVQVVVELKTRGGQAIPDGLELIPEVKLGIEPVDVMFTREKNRLVGNVPPAVGPGPWVLRVEVKDQHGALLGRDFLEIAKAPLSAPGEAAAPRVARK